MDDQAFLSSFRDQVERCEKLLGVKANEYATHDRLHNFRVAAQLEHTSMVKALAGMMAKHTVSIYDMCSHKGVEYSREVWDEKITDHLNYLFLLSAILDEDYSFDRPLAQ